MHTGALIRNTDTASPGGSETDRIMDSNIRSGRKGLLGTVTGAGGFEGPSRQEVFNVLCNRRRQCVIRYLNRTEEDGPLEFSDLVDYVTAWETDTPPDDVSPAQRKRVYNTLRQTHLPKLDDAGIVEYDPDTNRVEPGDAADRVGLYLDRDPRDTAWHTRYLTLSAAATGVIVANWFGVYPFGSVSGTTVGTIVFAVFAVSTLVHTVDARSNGVRTSDRLDIHQ